MVDIKFTKSMFFSWTDTTDSTSRKASLGQVYKSLSDWPQVMSSKPLTMRRRGEETKNGKIDRN